MNSAISSAYSYSLQVNQEQISPYQYYDFQIQMQQQIAELCPNFPQIKSIIVFQSPGNQIRGLKKISNEKDLQNMNLDCCLKSTILQKSNMNSYSPDDDSYDQNFPSDLNKQFQIYTRYPCVKVVKFTISREIKVLKGIKYIKVNQVKVNYHENVAELLKIFTVTPQLFKFQNFWNQFMNEFIQLTNLHDKAIQAVQKQFESFSKRSQDSLNYDSFKEYVKKWKQYMKVITKIIQIANNTQDILQNQSLFKKQLNQFEDIARLFLLICSLKEAINAADFPTLSFSNQKSDKDLTSGDFQSLFQIIKDITDTTNQLIAKINKVLQQILVQNPQSEESKIIILFSKTATRFLSCFLKYITYFDTKVLVCLKIRKIDKQLQTYQIQKRSLSLQIFQDMQAWENKPFFSFALMYLSRGIRKKLHQIVQKCQSYSSQLGHLQNSEFSALLKQSINILKRVYLYTYDPNI